ncbi:MAG: thermonuclease family protein [Anaerolineales bacterium]|nr:thermonuclease family protein [Anaerolineales bacterium]
MFQYEAKILRWVDGDTCWLDVDLGFYTHRETDVRLAGINTPERVEYRLQGIQDKAREFNEARCPAGASVIAEITTRDKYGRWLARIIYARDATRREELLATGRCLNDELISEGIAQPYQK